MEVNGIAHVMLTVSNFDACLPFYEQVLAFLGLRPVLNADGFLYCVGGRTAVGIVKAEDRWCDERFAQLRVGLHHVCFRARERADVDAVHEFLVGIGAITWSAMSMPAETPEEVTNFPSSTQRATLTQVTRGP